MAITLKYGKQNAMGWFLINPDNIRMLMTKWMNKMVNFCLGDIFSFVVCLVCGLPLALGLFGFSDTGDSPLTAIIGVEVVGYQARGGGTGVDVLDIGAQFRGEVLSVVLWS
jgi:hypothetical protein